MSNEYHADVRCTNYLLLQGLNLSLPLLSNRLVKESCLWCVIMARMASLVCDRVFKLLGQCLLLCNQLVILRSKGLCFRLNIKL